MHTTFFLSFIVLYSVPRMVVGADGNGYLLAIWRQGQTLVEPSAKRELETAKRLARSANFTFLLAEDTSYIISIAPVHSHLRFFRFVAASTHFVPICPTCFVHGERGVDTKKGEATS